ncbi:tankyrase-1-like [Trichogramma pretiosum]|uniref:tankyrase-1-like n=1 Tax=Trichogramma pretiosum TaxID=7493 RepID=UPI0006C9B02B|nr:tankyrase-1-like [Trichogramma pretiosum]
MYKSKRNSTGKFHYYKKGEYVRRYSDSYYIQRVDNLNYDSLLKLKALRENKDWNIKDEKFFSEIYSIINNWKGQHPKDLQLFLQPEEIEWLLMESMKSDDNETTTERLIDFLIEANYTDKLDVRDDDGQPSKKRVTPVHVAAAYMDESKAKNRVMGKLFKIYDRFHVDYADVDGLTHFHLACKYGCLEAVEKYLELKRNPNCISPITGDTPLHFALHYGHRMIADLLLRNGAKPNLSNYFGDTPLHIIFKKGYDAGFVQQFFKINAELQQVVKINARDKSGNTPLHLAVGEGRITVTDSLLRRNANLNAANNAGSTPLHILCNFDDDDVYLIKRFFCICDEMEKTVQIDESDNECNTALHLVLSKDRKAKAELLLRSGANPTLANVDGWTPLHFICNGKLDVKFLALFFEINKNQPQKVQLDAQNKSGDTPLHLALENGKKEEAEWLLRKGANPCLANNEGSTSLHIVCKKSYDDDFVKLYFEIIDEKHHQVLIDARDKWNNTPLHLALGHGKKETVVKTLLSRNADPNLANGNGLKPLHVICQVNHIDEQFLESFIDTTAKQKKPVEVDAPDKWGNTPLHLALCNGNKKKVELEKQDDLVEMFFEVNRELKQTVKVNHLDECGRTPLRLAAARASKKVIELLLRNGANPTKSNAKKDTPMHLICRNDRFDNAMTMFLRTCKELEMPVNVNARDKLDRTPLQWAVASLLENTVKELLEHGADLSSFTFPDESYFAVGVPRGRKVQEMIREHMSKGPQYQAMVDCLKKDLKIRLVFDMTCVLERLCKAGYILKPRDALTIMKSLTMLGLFENRTKRDERWYTDSEFIDKAIKIMLNWNMSLYTLTCYGAQEVADLIKEYEKHLQ